MMVKNILYFILILFFVLLLFNLSAPTGDLNIKYVNFSGARVKVDIASTPASLARGLSGRPSLRSDEGLLFIFDQPGRYSFWMKDMNFPIDIIWLTADLNVAYIKKDASPDSYPATFESPEDAQYVLEVVAGFAERNNIKAGDRVEFEY